jgi:Mrp family chromosome partitioning ATPase
MDSKVRSIDVLALERWRGSAATVGEMDAATAAEAFEPEIVSLAPAIEAAGTEVRTQRIIALDEDRREHERILPAGGILGVTGGAYKMLRTQVLRRLKELKATTLAVLSASNGEGKTLSAINLAVAIAADPGYTALLVDLDLRNPSVHRRFGFEPELGVEDCIEQGREVRDAMVQVAGYDRLVLLPARGRVELSSELLATERMSELVLELRTRYPNRIVIFDLPPVLLADDALAFSRNIQAGLFVVAEGVTIREDIARSMALLRHVPIVGTVLNRSRDSAGAYY